MFKSSASFKAAAAVAFSLTLLVSSAFPLSLSDVWINEFHYDNTSGDVDEFIEIAGVAGVDLSSFTLTLYNGGNQTAYSSQDLAGTLVDDGSGFGFAKVEFGSIQNGGPDGFSLYSSILGLVQFLSYEGSFTADGGHADGATSTDVGVFQNGAGAVGDSLQLVGNGRKYSDFIWADAAANTAGAVNTGQSFRQVTSAVPEFGSSAALLAIGLFGAVATRRASRRASA